MFTSIQKWGNSKAIRIPKDILEKASLKENDRVELKVENGNVVIVSQKKHKLLSQRIAEYRDQYTCTEWKTGNSTGREVL